MKAYWNGKVIAESDKTKNVEGNHYFPAESVKKEFLKHSDTHTVCQWKGTASYYDVVIDGQVNKDAAWYYPDPSEKASPIKNYIAFWRGVKVE
ncbi:MAG: DUF427 domain-containing protein [Bacteroidales bacterium]|nr:DUF427 domain-containing protein [Bacteroidales bacterium]MCF8402567.1 DUF427 domain-containing protein [Bacteroidales bacterium]